MFNTFFAFTCDYKLDHKRKQGIRTISLGLKSRKLDNLIPLSKEKITQEQGIICLNSLFCLSVVPLQDNLVVRNADVWDYLVQPENGTFAVNITWTGPAFDVGLCCYWASLQLSGYSNDKPFVKEVLLVRKTKLTKKTTMGIETLITCLLYTSPSPRDGLLSRMPSSA